MLHFNNYSSRQKINKEKNGFTFIELIITIFVAVVGIVGAFIIAQYPISYTSVSISRLTAAYLAQEGIEIVRNIRDTNWLEGEDWDNGLTPATVDCNPVNDKFCVADYNDLSLMSYREPPAQDPPPLKFDGNFYTYDSGTPTKFIRKIRIQPQGEDILKVSISVEWEQRGKLYTVEVRENLYSWWSD